MFFAGTRLDCERLPAPLAIWRTTLRSETWRGLARGVFEQGGRLLALWASDRTHGAAGSLVVSAAYVVREGLLWVDLPLGERSASYPDLAPLFPCAARMQRAAADLVGVTADGAVDRRPWLDHGAWPAGYFPLRRGAAGEGSGVAREVADYAFVRVEGDGVHEIPVGPVHAGIIEPGHFRFSVVGEKVLRLEQRLGYKHKGIEKRFTELPPLTAHRLAGRVSGDSTVAYAWAWCMALESLAELPDFRARCLAARPAARARARRQPPGRPRRAGQRCRFCLRPGPVLAPQGRLAAARQGGFRPPPDDGLHRPRRRRGGHRPGDRRPAGAASVRRHRHVRCTNCAGSMTSMPACRIAS
jgi:Ni,Fe-hydrogenase III component G